MPRLTIIRDLFAPHQRETIPLSIGAAPAHYVPEDVSLEQLQVIHNGKVQHDEGFLKDFIFSHEEEDLILRVLPGTVVIGTAVLFGLLKITGAAVLSAGLGMAINALMPPAKNENKDTFDNSEESPTYGWGGIQNTTRNGQLISMLYGRHEVAGQFLSTFTRVTESGQEKLYMLIGLCAGPINAINDITADTNLIAAADVSSDLKLNNNSASSFEGVLVSHRMGNWDQSIIPGFSDVIAEIDQSAEMTSTPYEYTTADEVQAFELHFTFPNGLYAINDAGSFLPYEIELSIRYKEYGGSYGSPVTETFSAQTRSEYSKTYRLDNLSQAKYVIEITRTTAADTAYTVSTCYFAGINEITYDDVAYKGIALTAIEALPTEQLSGRLPNVTQIGYGKEITVYQPNDGFDADTEQDFGATGDGKKYWGWHGHNTTYMQYAKAYTIASNNLVALHGTATTAWISGTYTAPFLYKEVTGDFDVSVVGNFISAPAQGDGVAFAVADTYGFPGWFAHVGLYYDSSTYKWRVYDRLGVTPQDNTGTASASERYFRVVRSGSSFTFYTGTNGIDWTQRDTATRILGNDEDKMWIGLVFYSDTAVTGNLLVGFRELGFADTTCISSECSNNPAWVIYNVLTCTDYGLGNYIDPAKVDIDTFIDFAAYCKEEVVNGRGAYERRHRFDGIVDSSGSAWEKALSIAGLYRATLLRQGDRIRIAWLRAQEPIQLFSMSNIVKGSFGADYQTPQLDANYWEVQFRNRDNEYEQDYIPYPDPDIEDDEPYRPHTTAMYGITRVTEALRAAKFRCKANRHITQKIKFNVGIDAVCCEPYDVISVQHDVPAWGIGGRVVSGTSNTVTLDKPVTIYAGHTYQVSIRHEDDTIDTTTVTNGAGQHTTMSVSPVFDTTPAEHEVWVFGQQNILTKAFVVTDIQQSGDLEATIEAVEYNADVYDDSIDSVPVITYTMLPDPRAFPDDVTHIILTERAQVSKDGSIVSAIDVTFTPGFGAVSFEIWYKESSKAAWLFSGTTGPASTHYVLTGNLTEDTSYDIAVVSVGPVVKKDPSAAPMSSIYIEGKTTPPPDVTNLNVVRSGSTITLSWDPVVCNDLAGYEIRYIDNYTGTSWHTAVVMAFMETKTQFITSDFAPGEIYFLIKAVNTSGIYSTNPAYVSATLEGRIGENILVSRDERALGWTGTKTDMTVSGSNLRLDAGETEGSYVTPEMDAGAAVRALITVYTVVAQVDLSLTWANATYTWGSAAAAATTWSGPPEASNISKTLSFRFGTATPLTGDYQQFIAGEYAGRYFQFKMEVTSTSTAYSVDIEQMISKVDPPDIIESGANVSISDTGTTTINFANFNVIPDFICVPNAGSPGDTVDIVTVSIGNATVRYYNISGTQVAGYVNWQARGY